MCLKSPVSMDKKYATRDGRPVRIYVRDHPSQQPIVGAVLETDGNSIICSWTQIGEYLHSGSSHLYDLVEVVPKIRVKGWLNVYKTSDGVEACFHKSREKADKLADISFKYTGHRRVVCIEIDQEVDDLSMS